jgi:hypothetical protein
MFLKDGVGDSWRNTLHDDVDCTSQYEYELNVSL